MFIFELKLQEKVEMEKYLLQLIPGLKKLQKSLIEIKEKEYVIKQQENILLQFSNYSEKYCVCMVDIMN